MSHDNMAPHFFVPPHIFEQLAESPLASEAERNYARENLRLMDAMRKARSLRMTTTSNDRSELQNQCKPAIRFAHVLFQPVI